MAKEIESKVTKPTTDKKNPADHYVVDTRSSRNSFKGLDWTEIDIYKNPAYQEIVGLNKEGKLAERYPNLPWNIKTNPSNFHTTDMLEGTEVYKTEMEGLIFIPKDKPEDAKRILALLQKQDPDIKLSPLGMDLK